MVLNGMGFSFGVLLGTHLKYYPSACQAKSPHEVGPAPIAIFCSLEQINQSVFFDLTTFFPFKLTGWLILSKRA